MVIVHAADLHLDSPMRGLDRRHVPVELRSATRRAFENLVDLCVNRRADLLLLVGDVFDRDWEDYETGLFFLRTLNRLRAVGTRVFLVYGNHDAKLTRSLVPPDHLHVFAPNTAPGTVVLEGLGVAVHGWSYPRPEVREDMVPAYPAPVAGHFNVGLLHCNANGSKAHAAYAATSVGQLAGKGYDYFALGHVHERAILHEKPWVVYPGNLQGRSIRECGARGAMVVEVEGPRIIKVDHVALDVARWHILDLDIATIHSQEDLAQAASNALAAPLAEAGGRILGLRVRLNGRGEFHEVVMRQPEGIAPQIRGALETDHVWVEKVILATRPPAGARPMRGIKAELTAVREELCADPTRLHELLAEEVRSLAKVLDSVKPHEGEGADGIPAVRDTAWLTDLLDRALVRAEGAIGEAR